LSEGIVVDLADHDGSEGQAFGVLEVAKQCEGIGQGI
jgi:hypothetical protein